MENKKGFVLNVNIVDDKVKEIIEKQKEFLEREGWYSHYVPDFFEDSYLVNAHTHGLKENFDHPDLQIVLHAGPNIVNGIFRTMIDKIKEGKVFKPDTIEENIIDYGYEIKLVKVYEMDREVLRIILPDIEGRFPEDEECDESFKKQEEYLGGK